MTDNKTDPASIKDISSLNSKNETRWLRLSFLVPLLLAICVTVSAIVAATYTLRKSEMELGVVKLRTSATRLYEDSLQQDMRALNTVMGVLERDETLRKALAQKSRAALLEESVPLFNDMKRNYGITHFYFTGPDRVNLLRVHQPQRYGDIINRTTTLNAERSGAVEHGVELGPLGLFTLRLVSPWYDTHTRQLIGYVELGMEIDELLEHVHTLFDIDVFVLVKKEFLQRKAWEEGMRVMGRTPDWDQFPDMVLSVQGQHKVPAVQTKEFEKAVSSDTAISRKMTCNGHPCQIMSLPLIDVAGRNVAKMVLLVDTSQQVAEMRQTVMIGSAASLISGAVLFVLFFWLVGRIGRRIERNEQMLQELATHDGLTGLYNHRAFYSLLEEEVARNKRYKHPVSMLMIDIDHFKRVNDTYGHMTGDLVLEGIAHLLQELVRQQDKVCRYGGEEISIIMPETGIRMAMEVAERLRAAVEKFNFKDSNGQHIGITISIGVATLDEHTATLNDLVDASDKALYTAKEGGRNRVCRYETTGSEWTAQGNTF